jgi:hypothetical protein
MGLDPYAPDESHLTGLVSEVQLGHLTAAEMQHRIGRRGRHWFSVVRNPWERLVSEYCFRVDQGVFPYMPDGSSWRDFVEYMTSQNFDSVSDRNGGRHLLRQCDFLFDSAGRLLVDRVFSFDRIHEVGPEVFGKIIEHRHQSSKHAPWWAWYDDQTENAVGGYFRDDVLLSHAHTPTQTRLLFEESQHA